VSPMEQKIPISCTQTGVIWQLHRRIETLTTTEELAATGGTGYTGSPVGENQSQCDASSSSSPPRSIVATALYPTLYAPATTTQTCKPSPPQLENQLKAPA
jgi:hypothetical protein